MRSITRRTVLRGLGTTVALPFLEAMMPTQAFGAAAVAGPKRIAWVYVPNGITMEDWTPAELGPDYKSTRILDPIAAFRDRTLIITGMNCDKANPNGDGAGDHARAMSAYLTGTQPAKPKGNMSGLKVGVSADQLIAAKIAGDTKFPSLELGTYEGDNVMDSYPSAYNANLCWRNETTPVAKDVNPQSVFDRLFGNGNGAETEEAKAKRQARRQSVLDFVLEDAKDLQSQMGSADKRKVDEYMATIREIEIRLNRTEPQSAIPDGVTRPGPLPEVAKREFPVHCKLMIDMMVLAFQGDLTRVITFPFTNEMSAQKYPWCGADVTHHGNSHHMRNPQKIEYNTRINVFHMQHFAYMLEKLDAIKEANGSLLDNSLICYGSGVSDGDRHNHDNLPLLMLGKGGGTVTTGTHIRVNKVPVNNLWMAMGERVGAKLDLFGDATGVMKI